MPRPSKRAAKRKAAVQPIMVVDHKALDEACMARAASKLDLNNLDLGERAFLGTCQEIYRHNNGCYTPFECFFDDLVRWTRWGNTPTLESLRARLADADDEFTRNWDGILHGVKRFVRNYPDLVAEFQKAAKCQAEQPAEAAHA